ncbi:cupin domain-containing protein [Methylophaga sp. OBS4]|uniref:cupin domain-containing protein n=1 Tax=Methylophaga sp. OBS4 TaxID=2991935 RepID=UPI00225BB76D|nr:cupin domain-containing protein [Methylophaga sp. OBS4]MCX4186949.1 cupin domain-containing protein [Methylophaga sp. OBS4]
MLVNRAIDRDWNVTDYEGIERSLFRRNDQGGRTSVVRMKKGAHFPQHFHQGDEEVFVLNGRVLMGGVELIKGDYLFTGAGEQHDIVALTDAELFISTQQAITLVT